ncbi:DUF3575 domain-containing protein [Bacteroides rodentium]
MLKRMMFLPLLLLAVLPLAAQVNTDSVYEFRFVPEKDMFFVPYGNNRAELERLRAVVRKKHEAIADGKVPVYVDGYCNSLSGETENLAVARLRSNRVKSELILHERLKEENFITRNHAEKGDWVTVRIHVAISPERMAGKTGTETAKTEKEGTRAVPVTGTLPENATTGQPEYEAAEEAVTLVETAVWSGYRFALRTNLLRWATLTSDLGIEWRIGRNIGILMNGSWTSWSWSDGDRRYALWKVSPEVRYYIGKEKRGYLGAMYHLGEFNYKLGNTGRQGDYRGGGITGGYTLDLNRALSLDFHAGVGYTRADYDKYRVTEGIRVRRGCGTKNYWGVNQAGVTLVWKFNH